MVVIVVIVVPHSSIPYYNVTKGKGLWTGIRSPSRFGFGGLGFTGLGFRV